MPLGSPADGGRNIHASGATDHGAGWDMNVALWTDGERHQLPSETASDNRGPP